MAAWFAGLLLIAAAAQASGSSRIIGGWPASIEAFPSIVQVEFNNAGFAWIQQCAGSVLNSVYVLSAAHCFDGPNYAPANRRIRAGTATRNDGGITALVSEAINHPSYGQNENDGDITVIRLAAPLTLSATVQPASLMAPGFVVPAGFTVTYAGWGVTSIETNQYAEQLNAVNTTIVDLELCRLRYEALHTSPPVTENMICAGNFGSGGEDACLGDGGGPLYFFSGTTNIVTGVISWGNGCGGPNYPGVSTQVSSFVNWIVETAV